MVFSRLKLLSLLLLAAFPLLGQDGPVIREVKQSGGQSYRIKIYTTSTINAIKHARLFAGAPFKSKKLGVVNASNEYFQVTTPDNGWCCMNTVLTNIYCPNAKSSSSKTSQALSQNPLWPGLVKDGKPVKAGTFSPGDFAWSNVKARRCGTGSILPLKKVILFQALGPSSFPVTPAACTLYNMLKNIILKADKLGLDSLIIPGISTGAFSQSTSWKSYMMQAIQDVVTEQAQNTKLKNLKQIFLYWWKEYSDTTDPWFKGSANG